MQKIIILTDCSKSYCKERIGGKPRCTHPEIKKIEPNGEYDWCAYPRCPSSGFLEDCPLEDAV